MSHFSSEQELLSCSEVTSLLAKEVVEDVLSLDEQQAVDAHLNGCLECRNRNRLTSGLPFFADEADGDKLEAGVAAVMEGLRRERNTERGWKAGGKTFAIAAGIAVLTLAGVWNLRNLFITNDGPSAVLKCAPSSPVETISGVFLTYCDNEKPSVLTRGGEVRVSLQRGTVGLLVDPERPVKKRVTVETPFGEVRVKGTLFTVRVDGGGVWVEVFRGAVEVIPEDKEALAFQVSAGNGAALNDRTTFRLSDPTTDILAQALRNRPSSEPADIMSNAIDGRSDSANASGAPDRGDTRAESGRVDHAEKSGKGIPHGRGVVQRRPVASSMNGLIKDARFCLMNRDWECAASRYQEVLKSYSRRPESTSVLISLAKIELRHLGHPKNALEHYRAYLERAPNGPLAEEAVLGLADSYRRLGQAEREKETLSRFVEKYPQSALLGKARTRLKQLAGPPSM